MNIRNIAMIMLSALIATSCATAASYHSLNPNMMKTSSTAVDPCDGLANNEIIWHALSAGLAVGAGASGVSMIPIQSETGRAALGGISVGIGIAAAIATDLASGYSDEFKRERCVSQ